MTTFFLILAACVPLQAEDLSAWQGEFISRATLINHPEMESLYQDISKAAEAQGKSYSAEDIKTYFKQLFHTDFSLIKITDNTVTYYHENPVSPPVTRTYTYTGEIADAYQKTTFSWHGFTSDGGGESDRRYTSLLMMKIHQHNNGVPHFHLRYAEVGQPPVTGPEFEQWWPTLLPSDTDITLFKKGADPERMARLLLP